MLKKLQRRIFWILSIAAVLLITTVIVCVYIVNSHQLSRDQRNTLISVSMIPVSDIDAKEIRKYQQIYRTTSFFTVEMDPDGGLTKVYTHNFNIDDQEAFDAARIALKRRSVQGKIDELSLRYLKKTEQDGSRYISFISTEEATQRLQRTLNYALLFGALAGAMLFFLFSLPLSRMLVRPIKQAWDTQRQFIADAGHELKTPLTVILANIGILKKHPNEPLRQNMNWLETAESESLRMKKLLQDMLDLARSEDSTGQSDFREIDLSDIASNVLLTFESIAFEKGVMLEGDILPDTRIHGSAQAVRQMIVILLDNAVKYAGTGGMARLNVSRAGSKACLQILNTGDPIPREALPHIFDRFYQGDPSHTDKQSFGLGLPIARSIAHNHGSEIIVASDEKATSFSVHFSAVTSKKR